MFFNLFFILNFIPVPIVFGFMDFSLLLSFFSGSERCNSFWIPQDVYGLEQDLNSFVFGQELVSEVVIAALRSHLTKTHRKKPLVFSFHGRTGGGKGYVAEFIIKHWFKEGENSKFVKKYQAKLHFPLRGKVYEYQKQLQNDLEETIRKCPKAMFVFDEVDKFPPHVLDGIKPYLDYTSNVNGYDFREAIFIFITNNGGGEITKVAMQKLNEEVPREELKLRDFENILKTTSFNDEGGGFFRSDLIHHFLIDYVVPFLPLELRHVELCIQAEMFFQKGSSSLLRNVISDITEEMIFGPSGYEVYSIHGCKGISEKVAYFLERERRKEKRKHIEF